MYVCVHEGTDYNLYSTHTLSQLLYWILWKCSDFVFLLTACTSSVKVEWERIEISKYT